MATTIFTVFHSGCVRFRLKLYILQSESLFQLACSVHAGLVTKFIGFSCAIVRSIFEIKLLLLSQWYSTLNFSAS